MAVSPGPGRGGLAGVAEPVQDGQQDRVPPVRMPLGSSAAQNRTTAAEQRAEAAEADRDTAVAKAGADAAEQIAAASRPASPRR